MPAAPSKESASSAVLAPAQFSPLESTPSLAPLQADKICPSWGEPGAARPAPPQEALLVGDARPVRQGPAG
ncbi:Rotatin [Manis pentadactyla]|nr:Rotatin [Manis pentadactyla]